MEDFLIFNTLEDGKHPDAYKENYHCHILCRGGEMRFDTVGNHFTARSGDLVIWQMTTAISAVRYSKDFDADFVLISNPFLNLYNPEQVWAIYSREMDKADTDETSSSLFMRFLTLLRQNCREQREVAWFAGELCVTPKYLSAICQKITGKGAAYWIEYYTLHEILLLLNNPSLTLTEITDRMHFPAPPMLTRYLKRTIGLTPSEYRNRGR